MEKLYVRLWLGIVLRLTIFGVTKRGGNKMITFTLSSQVWVAEDGENHLPGLIAHLIGTAIESLHSVLY